MSEEIGSTGLDEFVAENADILAADAMIASDGPRMKPERPDIKLGHRGAVTFDLEINLRIGSRHSGHWGGVLEDPGVTLAHAIAAIVTQKGRIIADWLPEGIPDNVRAPLAQCEVDPGPDFPEIDPEWGEPGLSRPENMFGWTRSSPSSPGGRKTRSKGSSPTPGPAARSATPPTWTRPASSLPCAATWTSTASRR